MTKDAQRGRPSGRPRFAAVIVAALVATMLLVAGCDGDDGDATSSEARDQFIAQADQICTEGGKRIETGTRKIFGAGNKTPSDEQIIEAYTDVTIPEFERIFDQIGELEPPPGDEDQIDEILSTADEALAEAEDEPANLAKPVGQGNPFDETNELLQDYGFEVCGGGNA